MKHPASEVSLYYMFVCIQYTYVFMYFFNEYVSKLVYCIQLYTLIDSSIFLSTRAIHQFINPSIHLIIIIYSFYTHPKNRHQFLVRIYFAVKAMHWLNKFHLFVITKQNISDKRGGRGLNIFGILSCYTQRFNLA